MWAKQSQTKTPFAFIHMYSKIVCFSLSFVSNMNVPIRNLKTALVTIKPSKYEYCHLCCITLSKYKSLYYKF